MNMQNMKKYNIKKNVQGGQKSLSGRGLLSW